MVRSVCVRVRSPAEQRRKEQRASGWRRRDGDGNGASSETVHLPSNSSDSGRARYVGAGLRFERAVAVANRGPSATNPNQHRMHGARLHLTTAHDRLRTTAGLAAAAAAFRALIHVQLTRLHRAATSSCTSTTPGTLYASPHPLHSTTGVRLTDVRPTPLDALDSPRRSSANFGSHRHPPDFLGTPTRSDGFVRGVFSKCPNCITTSAASLCCAYVQPLSWNAEHVGGEDGARGMYGFLFRQLCIAVASR